MTKITNYLKVLAALLVALAALTAMTMAVAAEPAEAGKKAKTPAVRVASQTLDDSPVEGTDGTVASTTIKAPTSGFLVIDASSTAINIQELDRLGCVIEVDNVQNTPSTRLVQVNGNADVNEQEICSTNTVVPVAKGTHTVDFESLGVSSIHTNFSQATVSAMFVPFDGNGNPPVK
jgi:hypothetical protein